MAKELIIEKGKTFRFVVRWGNADIIVRKPIESIDISTGAPVLTITSHGIPDGWAGVVSRVQGMHQINARNFSVESGDLVTVRVIDANHIELNGVEPVGDNGKEWLPATPNTGFFSYASPFDLAGCTARMSIKDKEGGVVRLSTESTHAPLNVLTAVVDAAAKTIVLGIDAIDTAAIEWKKGVSDLEIVSPSGVVTRLPICDVAKDTSDPVRVVGEITT